MSNVNPTTPSTPATPASATPAVNAAAPVSQSKDTVKQPVSGVVPEAKSAAPSEEVFEVQIDGKVEKKTRKEIIEAYQLRQLSDKKRSEAEKVLNEYKQLQEVSKRDPIKFMKAMGYDIDNIATGYLAKKAEDAMKDPAVLKAEQTEAELNRYKAWVEEQKSMQEKQKQTAAVDAERSRLHKEIIEAIEEKKELGMPVDEHLIIQIAQDMMVQDKAKKPLNAKEALPATYARTQKWLQGLASKMEGESLVKWLGDDVAKKIRKYDLQQLKSKRVTPQPGSSVKPQAGKVPEKKPVYKTWSQFKAETLDKIQ